MEYSRLAEDIVQSLPDRAPVTETEIATEIAQYVESYAVPPKTAKESIRRQHLRSLSPSPSSENGSPSQSSLPLARRKSPGEQASITGRVGPIWTDQSVLSDVDGRVGVVTDGQIRKLLELPAERRSQSASTPVTTGTTYRLPVTVRQTGPTRYLSLAPDATVTEVSATQLPATQYDLYGDAVLVRIHTGSGLITRCGVSGCSYTLKGSECPEHGRIDGNKDLRIKATFDDGAGTYHVALNASHVTQLTGLTVEDAVAQATEAGDIHAVTDWLHQQLICNSVFLMGNSAGDYIVPDAVALTEPSVSAEIPAELALLEHQTLAANLPD